MARENFSNLLFITEPEGLDKIFWEDNLLSAVSFQPGLLLDATLPGRRRPGPNLPQVDQKSAAKLPALVLLREPQATAVQDHA
jgi:hypothetical protein